VLIFYLNTVHKAACEIVLCQWVKKLKNYKLYSSPTRNQKSSKFYFEIFFMLMVSIPLSIEWIYATNFVESMLHNLKNKI